MAQTTVSQTAGTCVYYWGEGGQYGPFEIQQEGEWAGWPDAGQVMRYFRRKAGLTAKELGVLYGKAVNPDGSPVTERQIFRMELENKVPVDINRRKLIARLLNIPPVLFGLAVLEDITLDPQPQAAPVMATGQTKLVRTAIDTSPYQNNVRTLWQLHDTGNAQARLNQVYADIRDLESFEQQTQGDLRYHIQEILLGYQILATHIVRDQRQFKRAYYHDILKANVYMGLKEYGEVTKYARRALLACQDINSVTNTAIITDIYGRLLKTRYRTSSDVKELGEILRISPARPLIDAGE
jgi:hypothetical protein